MSILILFILGLLIGSFLGVVVDRFDTGQSSIFGRSVCDHCKKTLGVLDLIPVVSYLLARGSCRHCKTKLSLRYPLIECTTGILFVLTAWHLTQTMFLPTGFTVSHFWMFLLRDLLFVSLLLILFLIDARHGVLPDRFTIPGIILITLINLWLGIPLAAILIGGLAIGGFFAVQFIVSKGTWVGGGDIRLGALLGVMFGLAQGILALMIAYILGAIFAVYLLSKKKAGMKSELVFGPFLAIAGWIVLFFGTFLGQKFFPF